MSDAINPDHYKRLPSEAIEIIEAAIDNAPSNQDAYLHGQVLKYVLRCWNKNGIEDLKKAKWYLDRLIDSFDESEAEQLATVEVAGEVTGVANPPDGWRWLELGEVMRNGDTDRSMEPIPKDWIGSVCRHKNNVRRRNKFEAGEKVVHVNDNPSIVYTVDLIRADGAIIAYNKGVGHAFSPDKLAPYIEETKPTVEVAVEVTGEVKNPIGCPDGWRFLEVGEVIRKGDVWLENGQIHSLGLLMIGQNCQAHWRPIIRRNRFEVGEKVVHGDCKSLSISVVGKLLGDGWVDLVRDGVSTAYHVKDLAPYIEETK